MTVDEKYKGIRNKRSWPWLVGDYYCVF